MIDFIQTEENVYSVQTNKGMEFGQIYLEMDGDYVYQSTKPGCTSAWALTAIANFLHDLNGTLPKFSRKQAIVVTGYTNYVAVNNFSIYHEDAQKRLGFPIFTHEFAEIEYELRKLYKEDFIGMAYHE